MNQKTTAPQTSDEGKKLIESYEEMFSDPEFRKMFAGAGWSFILTMFDRITENMPSYTILDYGCGTASQLFVRVESLKNQTFHQYSKGKCQGYYAYDPSVPKFSKRPHPGSKFSIVACLEVMEHILEPDIPAVLADLASFTENDGIVMFSIAGGPSKTLFLDGADPHVTQKPLEWWKEIIGKHLKRRHAIVHHP